MEESEKLRVWKAYDVVLGAARDSFGAYYFSRVQHANVSNAAKVFRVSSEGLRTEVRPFQASGSSGGEVARTLDIQGDSISGDVKESDRQWADISDDGAEVLSVPVPTKGLEDAILEPLDADDLHAYGGFDPFFATGRIPSDAVADYGIIRTKRWDDREVLIVKDVVVSSILKSVGYPSNQVADYARSFRIYTTLDDGKRHIGIKTVIPARKNGIYWVWYPVIRGWIRVVGDIEKLFFDAGPGAVIDLTAALEGGTLRAKLLNGVAPSACHYRVAEYDPRFGYDVELVLTSDYHGPDEFANCFAGDATIERTGDFDGVYPGTDNGIYSKEGSFILNSGVSRTYARSRRKVYGDRSVLYTIFFDLVCDMSRHVVTFSPRKDVVSGRYGRCALDPIFIDAEFPVAGDDCLTAQRCAIEWLMRTYSLREYPKGSDGVTRYVLIPRGGTDVCASSDDSQLRADRKNNRPSRKSRVRRGGKGSRPGKRGSSTVPVDRWFN
jgi:hypothetical protein